MAQAELIASENIFEFTTYNILANERHYFKKDMKFVQHK
jgi:hypothetical protein